MDDFNAFVSPEYPVLHSIGTSDETGQGALPEHVSLSLGLIVRGIPSFLATIPVDEDEVHAIRESLGGGDVRVAVVGISVDGNDLAEGGEREVEVWQGATGTKQLPAAFLSLVCSDGRRIGIARIVAKEESASPEDVARFVLHQIAKGVQIPDLASTR